MRHMIRRRPTVTALLQDLLVTLPLSLSWPACAQDAAADRNALGEQILSKILMAFWTAAEPTFKPNWGVSPGAGTRCTRALARGERLSNPTG